MGLLFLLYKGNMEERNMESKRLYRSRNQCMICGVCGGIAEYFNVDPTIIRLAWVLFSLAGGSGLLVYFIAAIIIPEDSSMY